MTKLCSFNQDDASFSAF